MNLSVLLNSVLFRGITEQELKEMRGCLGAYEKSYQKGQMVYRMGDTVDAIGVVVTGSVIIENDDIWGNKSILDHVGPGQIFAETYACIPGEPLMVNVVASEKTEILFLNISKVITTCCKTCTSHGKLIRNLLAIASQKNLNLSRRIFYTSSKSIRGRLLSYLSHQAMKEGSYEVVIPFNRQQLADYLGVDRSAMSNELSKMRNEGILTFDKNKFILINKEIE